MLYDAGPPTVEAYWRATAERRWLTAAAIEKGLCPDAPPELVLLTEIDKDDNLITLTDYRTACKAYADTLGGVPD